MEKIYAEAEVCMEGSCLKLDPGLTELMRSSRDCQKLSDAWRGWRDQSRKKMKQLYQEYVQLSNEAIRLHQYDDLGSEWRSEYEVMQLENELVDLFDQVLPLYLHLHSYGYTPRKVFQTAEDFFYSLGFDNMTHNFWEKSMLERPEGREWSVTHRPRT
ncbi:hypothetical protein RRG08_042304 [Elysia crispata]|uniref:Angiotensin-converting enzyme n=1 Tax=Elysia crispata TaxID=231223 RepID=A0AAE0ZWN9_9GAST|nr:hypothetical protein RRG08_042304 [Elysia crispata]